MVLIWKQQEHFQRKDWFVQGNCQLKGFKRVWIPGSPLPLVLGTLNCAYWHPYFFHALILVWSLPCSSYLPFSSLNPHLFFWSCQFSLSALSASFCPCHTLIACWRLCHQTDHTFNLWSGETSLTEAGNCSFTVTKARAKRNLGNS